MELILRWDVRDQVLAEMKDMQILHVLSRVRHASLPGRLTVCDNVNGKAGRTPQNMEFIQIICSHGIK